MEKDRIEVIDHVQWAQNYNRRKEFLQAFHMDRPSLTFDGESTQGRHSNLMSFITDPQNPISLFTSNATITLLHFLGPVLKGHFLMTLELHAR